MGSVDWSRLTIVCVTHHSAAVIGPCMEAVRKAPHIIVVDNASDDETLEIVRRIVPQAHIIKNAIGTGYGTAANLGLEAVTTEFVLTLNPDAFISELTVAELLAVADRYPEAGMVSPAHRGPDKSLTLTHDAGLFERRHMTSPYDNRDGEPDPVGDLCAEFVSGAVNLMRRTALDVVGGFDANIFLYYDDDDMCLRMRHAGYPLIHAPHAEIFHVDGGSVRPSLGYVWEKFWHHGWSRLYIERKYNGALRAFILGLRHFVRFGAKSLLRALLPTQKNRAKAFRDTARCMGTLAYLIGWRAINPDVFARNLAARHKHSTSEL